MQNIEESSLLRAKKHTNSNYKLKMSMKKKKMLLLLLLLLRKRREPWNGGRAMGHDVFQCDAKERGDVK